MPEPIFSIVIPTLQRHETLKYAIQSVLAQTYKEFELIVMDNFSSKETAEVVTSFDDSRIKYHRAPELLLMPDNWELGLSHAIGEYIFILGDDDALMPDGLELALELFKEYQVEIISWFRYQYWWQNATVSWNRNKLFLGLNQIALIWDSREKLKQFYKYQAIFENMPMIYNSFVHRNVIQKVKSVYGRYFMPYAPDVYSGIVNAYFSDKYLYSFRSLSIAGLSGNSTGTSLGHQSLGLEACEKSSKNTIAKDLDIVANAHPYLVPSLNLEITVADAQIRTKELFFPDDKEIEIDIKSLLNFVAAHLNRDCNSYDIILKDIESLAKKHNISFSELNIPAKFTQEVKSYQGAIYNPDGSLGMLVINCEEVGISNVAQAAMLVKGICPSFKALTVIDETTKQLEEISNLSEIKTNQIVPTVIVDGVFFQQPYKNGINTVWRSLLAEWAENNFARYIVVLDRGETAPKIPGIRYRTTPPYNYANADADREMLQQVCDEEGADLFISTYYTTPTTTPSVLMAYDMIPEVLGRDLTIPMWREKHKGIEHASAYIAISQNTVQDLIKFFPQTSSKPVTVALCGIPTSFAPAPLEAVKSFKTKYGISKPYFLLVGTGGHKNTILFFQAFAQLPTKQGFEIVCTGTTEVLDPEFRTYTSGNLVHVLNLDDEELKTAYSGAVALVYPSKYEGFGLPVLEALTCGCPVITCSNASIPEVAGEAALYIKDDDVDQLTNALCDVQKPSVRESLIAAGLEQAKKFSLSQMAETVSSALINATLLHLNLKEINLIIFPDWSQDEETLGIELQEVMSAIATHPDKNSMTLLIDISNISEEDANLILSSVAMNLLMEEELDITDGSEISLVGKLSEIQWSALLPFIQARIILENENKQAISNVKAENLLSCDLSNFDESLKSLIQVLPIQIHFAEEKFNRGIALQKEGNFSEAIINYQQALDIKPDFQQAQQQLVVARYQQEVVAKGYQFTQDWFSWNIPVWQHYLNKFVDQPNIKLLEIGSWEGRSSCWLLDNVLTHPSSRITCIDTFEGSFEHTEVFKFADTYIQSLEARFDFNINQAEASERVHKLIGKSNEVLRTLPLNSYDIAYIDGSHIASDVLEDAVLVWKLVKTGGLIIFDDYPFSFSEKPLWNTRVAVDAFLTIFSDKLQLTHKAYQVIIEKTHD